MLSTDLILKGLGGVAVVGGTTGVGVWYLTKNKTEELKTFAERVGLSCIPTETTPTATVGLECSKGAGNIKVKRGETPIEVSAISGTNSGKIKVYKTSAGEKYNNNFKFVIEENDISGTNSNKLEQFETYEINKDGDGADWKLIRKSEAKDGIKKALGLPENCNLPANNNQEQSCDLTVDQFKTVNFDGKDSSISATGTPKLKISKVEGAGSSDYGPFGYKVVLESASDVTISSSVKVKASTNTEFKIKRKEGSNDISLEKAWTAASLGNKVNLNCTTTSGSTKECSLITNKKINVKDGTKTRKEAAFQTGSESKKLTFEENVQGHNQGIKFFANDEGGITLQEGTPTSGNTVNTIEKTNATYEIIKDGDEWYLSKVTSGGAGG